MGNGGMAPSFLTSVLDGAGGQLHAPATWKIPATPWIRGWVASVAGLDAVEYSKISYPGRPARSHRYTKLMESREHSIYLLFI
jgi:hypothetical protein